MQVPCPGLSEREFFRVLASVFTEGELRQGSYRGQDRKIPGRTTHEFARGWCFANAFVAGDTVYGTGSQHGPKVQMFVSQNLERWDTDTALDLPRHTIFNTSICKAGDPRCFPPPITNKWAVAPSQRRVVTWCRFCGGYFTSLAVTAQLQATSL